MTAWSHSQKSRSLDLINMTSDMFAFAFDGELINCCLNKDLTLQIEINVKV